MNRHSSNCACVVLLIAGETALGQDAGWDRGWFFREAAGVGSMTDLAALGASAEVQEQFAEEARTYFATTPADGDFVDAVMSAERQVSVELSWGGDAQAAFADVETARVELLQALGGLIDDAQELLPTGLQPYMDRAVANAGLDSPYRLLELTNGQREQIVALQRERDRVLRDARQWHRPARLEAARAAFAAAAEQLLTTPQRAELAQFQANIAANLEDVLDREIADYPETGEGSAEASTLPKAVPRQGDDGAGALAALAHQLRMMFEGLLPKGALVLADRK